MIIIRSRINGPAFIERVMQLVRAQKTEDAMRLCAQSHAPLPDIGLLILRSKSREEGDLQNVADAASLSVIPRLTRRLQYLPMLANVATLIGLFGTIYGLKAAFASVAAASAAQRSDKLAAGIAIALNATGFGLVTAIPLTVAHSYLASQAEEIIEQVDEFSGATHQRAGGAPRCPDRALARAIGACSDAQRRRPAPSRPPCRHHGFTEPSSGEPSARRRRSATAASTWSR